MQDKFTYPANFQNESEWKTFEEDKPKKGPYFKKTFFGWDSPGVGLNFGTDGPEYTGYKKFRDIYFTIDIVFWSFTAGITI